MEDSKGSNKLNRKWNNRAFKQKGKKRVLRILQKRFKDHSLNKLCLPLIKSKILKEFLEIMVKYKVNNLLKLIINNKN